LYTLIYKKLGTARSFKRKLWMAGLVVLAYCSHALFFVHGEHLKSAEVRKEYTDLHPIIRLAVATLIHVDQRAMVTDASRAPHDYDKMGLPRNARSLHLIQGDGYAHAVDLRTTGRPEWVNALVTVYFKAMGLETLRHVGTADHLHVSLPRISL